jgi:hypothetical protein
MQILNCALLASVHFLYFYPPYLKAKLLLHFHFHYLIHLHTRHLSIHTY